MSADNPVSAIALISGTQQAVKQPRETTPVPSSVVTILIGGTVAAAVAASSLDRGGFTGSGQRLLLILAAAALIEIALLLPGSFAAILRSPVVAILLLLAGLTALSSIWTIGSPASALRWGLVIGAYASLAIAGNVLVRRVGPWPIAAAIAGLAALEAVLGLGSAALRSSQWAGIVAHSWRPGGTYEYAAALGLAQTCALPAALRAATSRSTLTSALGALALVLAGATLGCIDSRTDLALAAATLVILIAYVKPRELARHDVLAAGVVISAAAVAGALLIGRRVTEHEHGGAILRITGLALTCAVLVSAWPRLRSAARHIRPRHLVLAVALATVVATTVWLAAGYASTITSTGGGFAHGRVSYWTAAIKAWQHRPILGFGANTFYKASVQYQAKNDQTIFAHDLPLELATELGILGLALGLALYAASARALLQTRRITGAWLLAAPCALFLLSNLVDWPWHLAGLGALWAVALGGILDTRQPTDPPTPNAVSA